VRDDWLVDVGSWQFVIPLVGRAALFRERPGSTLGLSCAVEQEASHRYGGLVVSTYFIMLLAWIFVANLGGANKQQTFDCVLAQERTNISLDDTSFEKGATDSTATA